MLDRASYLLGMKTSVMRWLLARPETAEVLGAELTEEQREALVARWSRLRSEAPGGPAPRRVAKADRARCQAQTQGGARCGARVYWPKGANLPASTCLRHFAATAASKDAPAA